MSPSSVLVVSFFDYFAKKHFLHHQSDFKISRLRRFMKTATTMIIVALGLSWTFDSNAQGISGRPPLVGRIFFASTDWTPGENYGLHRRFLGVMDADGRSRKTLTARLNGIVSFAWNSNLSVLTVANSSTDVSNDGWFNLKIEGDGALNSTVTSITPTLSRDLDNFFSESSGNPENSQAGTRARRHLSQTSAQTKCSPARKFCAVFS